MKLGHLSDDRLLENTGRLVREERERLIEVLYHLGEIQRRRLFSVRGFGSLFHYMVKDLKYPEDQAQRRISAMKILKEFPELVENIRIGTLNLSQLGLASTVFRKVKFSRAEKLIIFQRIQGASARETKRVLAEIAPIALRTDRAIEVGEGKIELRFVVARAILEKLDLLKGSLAHRFPGLELGELFEFLCDEQLRRINKTATSRDALRQSHASTLRAIRSAGKCEKCHSSYALEIDHRHPRALGGSNLPGNLRLLCRSCNQRAAIEAFGLDKMEPYL